RLCSWFLSSSCEFSYPFALHSRTTIHHSGRKERQDTFHKIQTVNRRWRTLGDPESTTLRLSNSCPRFSSTRQNSPRRRCIQRHHAQRGKTMPDTADHDSTQLTRPTSSSGNGRMSIEEISQRLGVGRLAVYSMLEQQIIPGIRLGRRWIVTRHAYEQW